MNFSDADLARLRKDIERVRRHEESRRSTEQQNASPLPGDHPAPRQSVSILVRLRRVLETLLVPSSPSEESLEAIPEYIVTLLQVIQEQPKFKKWLLAIENLPPIGRNEALRKMSFAFRVEDGTSTIADAFDRLQNPSLFKAFCQALRDG